MAGEADRGLYPELLGPAWGEVPVVVRRLHEEGRARGEVTIETGRGWARWLARVLGFPPCGENVATRLAVERNGDGQRWSRRFGGHTMVSEQRRFGGDQMAERMGVFECRFRLKPTAVGLDYEPLGAALVIGALRWPLPRLLAPRVTASTWAEGTRMRLDVSVLAPLFGCVLRYHGHVVPEATPEAAL